MPKPPSRREEPASPALSSFLQRAAERHKALWKGPYVGGDGLTQSMINRFQTCRERFRLRVVDGYGLPETFRPQTDYGHFFHLAEETHSGGGDWKKAIMGMRREFLEWFPKQRAEINRWY